MITNTTTTTENLSDKHKKFRKLLLGNYYQKLVQRFIEVELEKLDPSIIMHPNLEIEPKKILQIYTENFYDIADEEDSINKVIKIINKHKSLFEKYKTYKNECDQSNLSNSSQTSSNSESDKMTKNNSTELIKYKNLKNVKKGKNSDSKDSDRKVSEDKFTGFNKLELDAYVPCVKKESLKNFLKLELISDNIYMSTEMKKLIENPNNIDINLVFEITKSINLNAKNAHLGKTSQLMKIQTCMDLLFNASNSLGENLKSAFEKSIKTYDLKNSTNQTVYILLL